jgi:hypothetical protein
MMNMYGKQDTNETHALILIHTVKQKRHTC